jgi:hypothetical protein
MPKGIKYGGRQKGSLNKSTREIKALAQEYGPDAIAVLARIMNDPNEEPHARIAAAKELLDRGYGRASARMQFEDIGDHGDADIDERLEELYNQAVEGRDQTRKPNTKRITPHGIQWYWLENRDWTGMKVPPPVETRWKPGQCGNPGGRPKTHLLSEAFREALAEVDPKSQETYALTIARKIVHLAADKRTKLSSSLIMAIAELADRT